MIRLISMLFVLILTNHVFAQDYSAQISTIESRIDSLQNEMEDALSAFQETVQLDGKITLKEPIKLRDGPGIILGSKTVPANEEVIILEYNTPYFTVEHDGRLGYGTRHALSMCPVARKVASDFVDANNQLGDIRSRYRMQISRLNDDLIKLSNQQIQQNKAYINSFTANFRNEPNTNSSVLRTLEQGQVIYIQEKVNDWHRVKIDPQGNNIRSRERVGSIIDYVEGWVHNSLISENFVPKLTSAERRRIEFVRNNRDLSEQQRQDILKGTVRIGMTREMVRASWGDPRDINRTVTQHAVSEQWVYGGRRYLYFRNGIMTSFQD